MATTQELLELPQWQNWQSDAAELGKARDRLFEAYVREDPRRVQFWDAADETQREQLYAGFVRKVGEKYPDTFRVKTGTQTRSYFDPIGNTMRQQKTDTYRPLYDPRTEAILEEFPELAESRYDPIYLATVAEEIAKIYEDAASMPGRSDQRILKVSRGLDPKRAMEVIDRAHEQAIRPRIELVDAEELPENRREQGFELLTIPKKDMGTLEHTQEAFHQGTQGIVVNAVQILSRQGLAVPIGNPEGLTDEQIKARARQAAPTMVPRDRQGIPIAGEDMPDSYNEVLGQLTGAFAPFFVPGPVKGAVGAGRLAANPKLLLGVTEKIAAKPSFWAKLGTAVRTGAAEGAAFAAIHPPNVPLAEEGEMAGEWSSQALKDMALFAGLSSAGVVAGEAIPAAFYRRHKLTPQEFKERAASIINKEGRDLTPEEQMVMEAASEEARIARFKKGGTLTDIDIELVTPRSWTQRVPFVRDALGQPFVSATGRARAPAPSQPHPEFLTDGGFGRGGSPRRAPVVPFQPAPAVPPPTPRAIAKSAQPARTPAEQLEMLTEGAMGEEPLLAQLRRQLIEIDAEIDRVSAEYEEIYQLTDPEGAKKIEANEREHDALEERREDTLNRTILLESDMVMELQRLRAREENVETARAQPPAAPAAKKQAKRKKQAASPQFEIGQPVPIEGYGEWTVLGRNRQGSWVVQHSERGRGLVNRLEDAVVPGDHTSLSESLYTDVEQRELDPPGVKEHLRPLIGGRIPQSVDALLSAGHRSLTSATRFLDSHPANINDLREALAYGGRILEELQGRKPKGTDKARVKKLADRVKALEDEYPARLEAARADFANYMQLEDFIDAVQAGEADGKSRQVVLKKGINQWAPVEVLGRDGDKFSGKVRVKYMGATIAVDGGKLRFAPESTTGEQSATKKTDELPSQRSEVGQSSGPPSTTPAKQMPGTDAGESPSGVSGAESVSEQPAPGGAGEGGVSAARGEGRGVGRDGGTGGDRGRGRAEAADGSRSEPPGELEQREEAGGPEQGRIQDRPVEEQNFDARKFPDAVEDASRGGAIGVTRKNIKAIKLLKRLEAENRLPSEEEKGILMQYRGWGGLPNALSTPKAALRDRRAWLSDNQKKELASWEKSWAKFYDELKELLTPEEWRAAQKSTRNAHFTSFEIIEQMWAAIERLGFRGGNILELGAGIGHFASLQNDSRGRSAWTMVERDSLSARILRKLHPLAEVHPASLEDVKLDEGQYQLMVGNVPFAPDGPKDSRYPSAFNLHQYFFARGIDALEPGGLVVAISTHRQLDEGAGNKAAREWMAERADLVGAIRLPNTAFKANAGTEVTTDIIILRKKTETPFREAQAWIQTNYPEGWSDGWQVNEYFVAHPEMMLGKPSMEGEMYGGAPEFTLKSTGELQPQLAEAVMKLPGGVMGRKTRTAARPRQREYTVDGGQTDAPDGTLLVIGNEQAQPQPMQAEAGRLSIPYWAKNLKGQKAKRAISWIFLKERLRDLLDKMAQAEVEDAEIERLQKDLGKEYDQHVKKYGRLQDAVHNYLEEDPDYSLMQSLEIRRTQTTTEKDKDGRTIHRMTDVYEKAPIFNQRTVFPRVEPTAAANLEEAIDIALNYRGGLDLDYMGELLGQTGDAVAAGLIAQGLAFRDPKTRQVIESSDYLSGNVRDKLRQAKAAGEEFAGNVAALEKVQPDWIPISDISMRLGSSWLPPELIQSYISDRLGVEARISYSPETGKWFLETVRGAYEAKNRTTWGTKGFLGTDLVERSLNLKTPVVREPVPGEEKVTRIDKEATAQAQEKQSQLQADFKEWVQRKTEFHSRLETLYNEQFNTQAPVVQREPSWTYYPGAMHDVELYPHQKRVVSRILRGNTLLAHAVGTGKTFVMTTAAMEMRRLGMANKPMIVVQNSTLGQFPSEFRRLYPDAKILAPTKKQREGKYRRRILSMIATGDWDAVIVPHSWFEMIRDDPTRVAEFTAKEIDELEKAIIEARLEEGENSPKLKDLQKRKDRLEDRLKDLQKRKVDEKVMTFEQLGVDALFVDEAHAYKKLEFTTQMDNIKGLDKSASKRGLGLFMKARYIFEQQGPRNLVLATGTPITNTIAEAWTMMRYLRPDLLEKHNIARFDEFASSFGDTVTQLEQTAGGSFKMVTRFARYANGPELVKLFHTIADVVLKEDAKLANEPKMKGGQPQSANVPMTPKLKVATDMVRAMLDAFESMTGLEKRENSHIPLVAFHYAKAASLDLRLLPPEFHERMEKAGDSESLDEPGSKLNEAVRRAYEIWLETEGDRGAQAIFADLYQNKHTGFNLYEELKKKLIERGIPKEQIGIANEATTDAQRDKLFADVNTGRVRIVIGGTQKMGIGVNMNKRLAALHHLDAPPRPMDYEQRNGRIIRQGNMFDLVTILNYGVEGSLDATLYQRLAMKQRFINQILKGNLTGRSFEDAADEVSLGFDEMMAVFSGNPLALERVGTEQKLRQLEMLRRGFRRDQAEARRNIEHYQKEAPRLRELAQKAVENAEALEAQLGTEDFAIGKKAFENYSDFTKALQSAIDKAIARAHQVAKEVNGSATEEGVGDLTLFGMPATTMTRVYFDHSGNLLEGSTELQVHVNFPDGSFDYYNSRSAVGLIRQIRNTVDRRRSSAESMRSQADRMERDVTEMQQFIQQPFQMEAELAATAKRLDEIEEQLAEDPETPTSVTEATAEAAERANLEDDDSVAGIVPRSLRRFLGADTVRLPRDVLDELKSEDPEVEKRFQDARLERQHWYERLGGALDRLRLSFARSFPHLEPKTHGRAIEALRQYRQTREFAQLSALSVIRGFTADFGPKRYDVFRRYVILADLLGDVEAGRHTARELPFGYKSVEALRRDFEKVSRFVEANPEVKSAIKARRKFFDSLRTRLVELDRLPESVLEREDYFHRQILQHVQLRREFPGATAKDVRAKRKGFERKRLGSALDYNTEYLESEFEVIADAIAQIATVETLIRIDKDYNVQKTLKQSARDINEKRFYERWAEIVGGIDTKDPLQPYRATIAYSFEELGGLAKQGYLDAGRAYEDIVEALAEGRTVTDPRLWDFLQMLLEEGRPGAKAAGRIFKAIRERREFIKSTLGDRFVTWKDLVPEGYTIWQPEPGNAFFWTNSVTDKILDEVMSGERKMTPAETNRVLAVGARKPEWVIPEGIAKTLSDFKQSRHEGWIEQASAAALGKWKQWILLNPWSVVKYNLNNLSGDADIVLAYQPKIFAFTKQAASDLMKFHKRERAATAEMLEMVRRGVIGSGFAGEDVPNVVENELFDVLLGRRPSLHKKYWRTVRGFTQWREDVLRVAAYRYFLQELGKARRLYGASNPTVVDQIPDIRDRAAKLARELVGDYGNISEAGRWIRRHMIPFWSWMEINAPRYYKMYRNLPLEGEDVIDLDAAGDPILRGRLRQVARAAGWKLGKKIAALTAKALILVGAVTLWNRIFFSEEDKELNRQGEPLKLILGRDDDGNVRSIRVQGALSDATGWIGFERPLQDVEALVTGERSVNEQLHELYKAPVNRIVNGALPVQKAVLESIVGMKTYPDMWNPRPVRDEGEQLASSVGMQRLYRVLTGKPNRGVWRELTDVMFYTHDTGELAYYTARGMVFDWIEQTRPGDEARTIPGARSNALHYHRLAVRYNDLAKADKYLRRYFELGGNPKGLYQSIARGQPLEALKKGELEPFMDTLSAEEKAIVEQAEQWYEATYLDQEATVYNVDRVLALWEQWEAESARNGQE